MPAAPGGGNVAFLTRGRGIGGTVVLAPPDPAGNSRPTGIGISGDVSSQGVTFEGRLSLGILAGMIVGLVAFYMWTRNAQG